MYYPAVELIPPKVKLAIFWRVPQRVKWKTIAAALSCKSPQDVMAPVVADPAALGYARLYCLMLDRVRRFHRDDSCLLHVAFVCNEAVEQAVSLHR